MPHERPKLGDRKPQELGQSLSALSLGSHLVSMCFVLLFLQTSIHSSVHTWPNVAALVQQSIENLCYTF